MAQSVVVLNHAKDDILAIAAVNKAAAATVLVVLEQLKADPQLTIDKLTTSGANDFPGFNVNVKSWRTAKFIGNLWRIRILDTPATGHRVIYGYHYQTQQLLVFAVVDKENYDYDDLTSEINQRIFADWRSI